MSDWSAPPQAFTSAHVSTLTGLSDRQLRSWDDRGFFRPAYADEKRRSPFSRVYSFRDVVGLRTIAVLLKQHHVPHKEVEIVGRWLSERYATPWASLRFFVLERRVLFEGPDSGLRYQGRPPHQAALPIELRAIEHEMAEAAKQLRQRKSGDIGKIGRHRYVAHNADVLAGTRIPTAAIWEFHQAGYDTASIVGQYPTLTESDVDAAVEHESRRRAKKGRVAGECLVLIITFLLDEDVPEAVAQFLRQRGHRVEWSRALLPLGSPDQLVIGEADRLGAVVVT